MQFKHYSKEAEKTAVYAEAGRGTNLLYPALKLAEEAGEVTGKLGKFMRKNNVLQVHQRDLTPHDLRAIAYELGDVLWYVNALSRELGFTLEQIAEMNIEKLSKRSKENTIIGEGDDR